jgi:hypothetical protein
MNTKQWALLLFVAALGFTCVLSTKTFYQGDTVQLTGNVSSTHLFPYHVDEWQHLALSIHAADNLSLAFLNPYIESAPFKYNFEAGFTVLNAVLITLIPVDPVRLFAVLPAVTMFFSVLSFFYLLHQKLGFTQSLIGALFLIFIPSNVNLTGFWFYTPFTASLPFLFTALGLYFKNGIHLTGLLTAGATLAMYPPAFFLLFFLICTTEIIKATTAKRRTAFIGAALTMIVLALLLNDFTIFNQGWQQTYAYQYNPFSLLGTIFTLLATAGLLRTALFDKEWLVWPVLTGAALIFYHVFGFTLLIPYPRLLYYFLIGAMPLAAIGLYHTANALPWSPIILACVLVTGVSLLSYHDVEHEPFKLQQFISEDDYTLLNELDAVSDEAVVLTNPALASTVYPTTKNYVPALPDSLLKYGDISTYRSFIVGDCDAKTDIIEEHGIEYVITGDRITCDGFNEVFMNNKRLYNVTPTS